jgi:hypothetical protein
MSETWHRVAAAADIPEGRMQGFEIDGRVEVSLPSPAD